MRNTVLFSRNMLLLFTVLLVMHSCSDTLQKDEVVMVKSGETMKDYDGNKYETIKIDDQIWMAENLNVSHFRNGDPVLQVTSNYEWFEAGEQGIPVWRYHNDDPSTAEKYGKLYNGYAVSDPRGLAPEGWKIPGMDDWQILMDYIAGGKAEPWPGSTSFMTKEDGEKVELKSNVGWSDLAPILMGIRNDTPAVGNEVAFNAQFLGEIDRYGNFYGADETAMWWTSPIDFPRVFMGKELNTELGKVHVKKGRKNVIASPGLAQHGYAVRLVKE